MKHAPDFFRSDTGRSPDVQPQSFAFGTASPGASAVLPAIDRINQRMVPRCRSVIEPLARARVNVTAAPITLLPYADWQADRPDATLTSLYGFAPMKGAIMLAFAPATLRILIDRYFGGTARQALRHSAELTPGEEDFLGRLTAGLISALTDAWAKSLAVDAVLRTRETRLAYAALVAADDPVAVCAFAVEFAADIHLAFDIVYPLAGLRSIDQHLVTPAEPAGDDACPVWRTRLGDALAGVTFDARTVLARPQISLEKLMALTVGDVLPVTMNAEVPMLVADRAIAMGTIGDANGCAALQISRMLNRKSGQ